MTGPADAFELSRAITFAALIGGTLDYAIITRHRAARRIDLRNEALIRETSLPALVRITLLDEQTMRTRPVRSLFRSHRFGRGPLLRRQVQLQTRKEPVWITRMKSR